MSKVDQFESVFKAATRTLFEYAPVEIRNVLLISDLKGESASRWAASAKGFLGHLGAEESLEWEELAADRGATVGELLDLLCSEEADLVCTYRNLYSDAWRWPYSLGEHLDVLTQATETPVLVLPRPEPGVELPACRRVMAITDHLTGDARLVNHAARFTPEGGTLHLTHVEDERVLDRYLEVIGKIPEIDTETAEELIPSRLLKEPADYIASCKEVLRAAGLPIELAKTVSFGHHVRDVERLVAEHGVDLLVFNTKDEDQQAMHGLAYPLAVELRTTPLLML